MSQLEILERINGHDDLVRLNDEERAELCQQIRSFLVESVSQTGGHLASNLGVVELTIAIETVFNTAVDRLVFDVGHQSYVHKLLTGRRADFRHLRQFGGISGFPKPSESETDAFVAGHASSSVSIALGMARARTLQKQSYHVIALMGDGAATGGMAYEGLNDVAVSREPMIIILNDNEMSIGKNVGGLSKHLSHIRSSEKYLHAKWRYRNFMQRIPGGKGIYRVTSRVKNRIKRMFLQPTIFENMGLTYLGPVDGHDLPGLIGLLQTAKEINEPVLLHVVTKKGNGYYFAENDPAKFHGIGKFDPLTGKKLATKQPTFSSTFGNTMVELAEKNEQICAVCAAMPGGTGLLDYMKQFPKRYFDVGIAEEHAVSMAAGLACQGMVPIVAIYSTFLQRAYDQIIQDVSMMQLHVIFAVDRAGLVGDDGPTHHGVFDVGFFRQIPCILLLAPLNLAEQRDMLIWAVENYSGPVAIRYPRGGEGKLRDSAWCPGAAPEKTGLITCHRQGHDVTLLTYGTMLNNVMDAAAILASEGIDACVIRLLSLSTLPLDKLLTETPEGKPIVVIEEVCRHSGISGDLARELEEKNAGCQVFAMDLGENFVPGGSQSDLYSYCGLDAPAIVSYVKEVLSHEN